MKTQQQLCQIATTFLKGIGIKKATLLISRLPSVDSIFEESIDNLHELTKLPMSLLLQMNRLEALEMAKLQLDYIHKFNIKTHFFLDSNYPRRLKQCDDAPLILYSKGEININLPRVIAVVGTRLASEYGKDITEKLIKYVAPYDIQIVSGLAYGTDYNAHKNALDNQLSTIGVLGHGLDRMYPFSHREIAEKMCQNRGGLVTEFPIQTAPDRMNFPMRNRIVAGMSDALIVIESKPKGGSMITAQLAFDYNREVIAFPGNINHENSSGCNFLIQKNMAHLISKPSDLIEIMNWETTQNDRNISGNFQQSNNFNEKEKEILSICSKKGRTHFDQFMVDLKLSAQELNNSLFNLEMEGAIKALPGRMYET